MKTALLSSLASITWRSRTYRREPSREATHFVLGHQGRVTLHPALGASIWDANHGALPRHQGGESPDLIYGHILVVANAALAGTASARVLDAVSGWSARLGLVVVGSLPEKVDERIYNTAYVIDRGDLVGSYRKLHMFSTMGEDRFLSPGDRSLVVATSVGRLGVAICYDLRFPELFRKMALEGAEVICLPAEWPRPRQEHWRTLLRARAMENQLFVVAANCCGIQGKLDFFGMSLLLSARGEVLAEGGETDTEALAIFDYQEMLDYRAQIRCYDDRRPEVYGRLL